jgi:hypothetical protein
VDKFSKENSERTICTKEVQMANKYVNKCSPSMATKEMQIKMTLRFHLTPVKMAIINNTTTNAGRGRGKRNPSTMLVGM